MAPDGGSGMDVDTRLRVRHLGDDTRDERHPEQHELVRHPVVGQCLDYWIAGYHLGMVFGRRVAIVARRHIGGQRPPYLRQLGYERRGYLLGPCPGLIELHPRGLPVRKAQSGQHLLAEQMVQPLHIHTYPVPDGVHIYRGLAIIAGKKDGS